MEFHPIANMFPLMGDGELDELSDSIAANGLHQPIVMYEGKILDGRNRYRAWCDFVGEEVTREQFSQLRIYPSGDPGVTEYEGDDPVDYVWSLNMVRRHLTQSQKAASVAERETVGKGWWRKAINSPSPTQEELAENIGVSPAYAKAAAKIQRESPEHFDKLKSGEMTVTQAKRELQPEPTSASAEAGQIETLPEAEGRIHSVVEPKSDIVVEFAGKKVGTLGELLDIKLPDDIRREQFIDLNLAVIKSSKLLDGLMEGCQKDLELMEISVSEKNAFPATCQKFWHWLYQDDMEHGFTNARRGKELTVQSLEELLVFYRALESERIFTREYYDE